MYNARYKSSRPGQVDVFTACQVSVDLNPKPFINREELRVYQKNTKVAMTALKSHKIEVSKPCQNTTVTLLGNRDRPIRKESVQHQNKTRCLSGMDRCMATNDARLRQHLTTSEARLDQYMLQRDTPAGSGRLSIH